jgi:membrane-bound lytic murein transglycosylase A
MKLKTCVRGTQPGGLAAVVLILGLNLLCLSACQPKPKALPAPDVPLIRLAPSDYPHFSDDLDHEGLEYATAQSIAYLQAIPPGREYEFGRDRYTAGHVLRSLQRFQGFIRIRPSAVFLRKYIQDNYVVYRSSGRDQKGEVLFTGYYEPQLKGRRSISPEYQYPIYGRPDDLLTIDLGAFSEKHRGEKLVGRVQENMVIPYHDRREIDQGGVLYGKSQPLMWIDDPVDLFFLHVQGSGKVVFEDGQAIRIGYDSSNGRPYRSIAQLLIDEGKITRDEMSMQRLRAYLNENPSEISRVLSHNPSYIFFRVTPGGPLGSLNVKLTPGRSLALDRKIFPPAALTFIETQKPLSGASGNVTSWVDCRRFMLNQDTGGAIQGPGRADVFWGSGPSAEIAAGHLKHPGRLYFLVLKPEAALP